MLLQEFYENLMSFWSNLLSTPVNFFTAVTTFIFIIIQTIGILFGMFFRFFDMITGFLPSFLKPFVILILAIRFLKFVLSRHNSPAH